MSQTIFPAVIGTSLMTGYSYLISDKKKDHFREPELLNEWLHSNVPALNQSHIYGWLLHYGVGESFVIIYKQFWRRDKLSGLIGTSFLGLISGLIGASVWKIVLKTHPNPPKDTDSFFRHLLAAHVVFSLGSRIGLKLAQIAQ